MERIVAVARASFADNGFAGTSMRAVALAAGVDPRLIQYYFGDKTSLLRACLQPPSGYLERVHEIVHGPMRNRGAAMVRNMVTSFDDPSSAAVLRAIMLTAAHEPVALQRVQEIYRDNMVAAVADGLDDEQRFLRANLAASAIIGACYTRYLYQLQPLAGMAAEDVVQLIGPKVQLYLSGRLPEAAGRALVSADERASASVSRRISRR